MVQAVSWHEFLTKAKQIYVENPVNTRYSLKYRASDSEVALKVTDDRQTVQFTVHKSDELQYVDKINSAFIKLMTSKQPETVELTEELAESQQKKEKSSTAKSTSTKSSSTAKAGSKKSKRTRS